MGMDKIALEAKIAEIRERLANVQGSKCEVYSRIVGYHRPVDNWNTGKQEEFRQRHLYAAPEGI